MFTEFAMALLSEFNEYGKQDNINIETDGSGFSGVSIYATLEELEEYAEKIKKILEPAFKRSSKEQMIHTFATVITPPRKDFD